MNLKSLFVVWMLMLSMFMVFQIDQVPSVKAETPPPLVIENRTYYINETLTIDSQDVIMRNSTIILTGYFTVLEHNLTIDHCTFLFNSSASYNGRIRIYGRINDVRLSIDNSIFDTYTGNGYVGIYANGRHLTIYTNNTKMDNFMEYDISQINNLYIQNLTIPSSEETENRLVVGIHSTGYKGIYGQAIIKNSTIAVLKTYDISDAITIINSTIGTYQNVDWGTVRLMGNDIETIDNQVGQTKIYHWARIHIMGNDSGIFVETAEGRQYVSNNTGVWIHTWNIYEDNDARHLDIYVGQGDNLRLLPVPDYHKGVIDIYIVNTTDGLRATIPANMTYQAGNETGAVGTPPPVIEHTIYAIFGMNCLTLALVLILVLISLHIIRVRKRGD